MWKKNYCNIIKFSFKVTPISYLKIPNRVELFLPPPLSQSEPSGTEILIRLLADCKSYSLSWVKDAHDIFDCPKSAHRPNSNILPAHIFHVFPEPHSYCQSVCVF